ncbi:integral membrane protein [Candidatus Kinetoplastibacterium blastocrithidii TCC012E]|uniref:Integral membrane protein n=1 Tax=Candidatus Kinetoplastidibacterium blastocrithidiae TCC012E TaxID=1208922 RepID=M1LBJ5_9PROT|nr:DMT family transporter [Candidatus Kinetoplastibacterium blastocrithidii]AFZ83686.1 integral membrane protein [Candidatus Kinetoplastibacterium blastocrithidii (ex Strigomonas culicis)]AGF49808.1 integral membrane protein [Candidatus Kinetoplastibacterium blastocrithidii TCC012E]
MQSLWMLLASIFFSLMGTFVKISSDNGVNLSQIMIFRGVPSVVLISLAAFFYSKSLIPINWNLHIWRSLYGVLSLWMSIYSIANLPLALATCLNYTGPLFIAAWIFVYEKDHRNIIQLFAVLFGFIGVITIISPSSLSDYYQLIYIFLGLMSGALSALAMIQIKELGRLGESGWLIVLYFSLTITISGFLFSSIDSWEPINSTSYLCLIGIGISGLLGQLALTRAFAFGSTFLTATLQYSAIIFSNFIAVIFFLEHLEMKNIAGMAIIILSSIFSSFSIKK